ncbi:MAG: hypothetical protein KF865_09165 [Bdellovibrionaceae bacterium]|nr:hypothetical protein [Pseudobdellovibrionaceae bacterium]
MVLLSFRNRMPRLSFVFLAPLLVSACGGGFSGDTGDDNQQQSAEPAYCAATQSYSGGVAVTGVARYEFRAVDTALGLNGNPIDDTIPMAEISVTNAAGAVVQCGATDASGNIALTLPAGADTYTLRVFSRSETTKLKISVLEDYYVNAPYALTSTFAVAANDTAKNIGTITARARLSQSAKLEGGAFNIYKQIWRANEYLRSATGNSSFVAPKVAVYWKKGYNPYDYFGGGPLLSFYRPGYRQLFILGGNGGAVHNVDTDHFDNSIILHEYGHFLEDAYAKSDSPGGSHDGDFIIDPRLAWSEGWANYFQAAVMRSYDSNWRYYIDTMGFSGDSVESGTGRLVIKVDMTMTNGRCAASPWPFDSIDCDPVSVAGEGTYREMSISRYLFKTTSSTGANVPFSSVWQAFSSGNSGGVAVGLASPLAAFRNVGLFNSFLKNLITDPTMTSDWNTLRNEEKQADTTHYYADNLTRTTVNTCATRALSPTVDLEDSEEIMRSNLFTSNHFYRFEHDGSNKSIRVEYTGGSVNMDLDLLIYQEDHYYQDWGEKGNGGIVRYAANSYSNDQGAEQVSLNGLAAGRYLINVKAYTEGKTSGQLNGTAHYRLKVIQNSTTEDLCPAH